VIGSKNIRDLGKSLTIYFYEANSVFLRFIFLTLRLCSGGIFLYSPRIYLQPCIPKPRTSCWGTSRKWHVTHDNFVMYMKAVAAASWIRTYYRGKLVDVWKATSGSLDDQPSSQTWQKNSIQSRQIELKLRNPKFISSGYWKKCPCDVRGYSVMQLSRADANASLLRAFILLQGKWNLQANWKYSYLLLDPAINPEMDESACLLGEFG